MGAAGAADGRERTASVARWVRRWVAIAPAALLLGVGALVGFGAAAALAAGPPYPSPKADQVVYDFARVFSTRTITTATATIDAVERRTGAEVVVYTQVKPESDTREEAERDAIALIDQWGVGRRGFDDGLVILFDLDESRCHGQVQLYAAPGYRAAYLTNEERQAIYEEEMLPLLRDCDLDGALLAALERIDARATPEHAAELQRARQLDAAVGLVGAPLAVLVLSGWAAASWFRYGRDPVYLDDPSIHMPAPPHGMSPAAAALIHDGRTHRRALLAAMLHLASRGELSFLEERGRLGQRKLAIQLHEVDRDDPRFSRARRERLTDAEEFALSRLRALGGSVRGYIPPEDLPGFGRAVPEFSARLERGAVQRGWFREQPGRAVGRWRTRGGLAFVAGVVAVVIGISIPSQGSVLLGAGLVVAGIVMLLLARYMPARTRDGAMLFAMLAAYRRTLRKTLDQARSMNAVVASRVLPWVDSPDRALVWSVALDLGDEAQKVLERSLEDLRAGDVRDAWVPAWYGAPSRSAVPSATSGPAGTGGLAPGLMSSAALPNLGGMMAVLGTIGAPPSSSSSGGGGFSGGGSGGGGGGAGGGF